MLARRHQQGPAISQVMQRSAARLEVVLTQVQQVLLHLCLALCEPLPFVPPRLTLTTNHRHRCTTITTARSWTIISPTCQAARLPCCSPTHTQHFGLSDMQFLAKQGPRAQGAPSPSTSTPTKYHEVVFRLHRAPSFRAVPLAGRRPGRLQTHDKEPLECDSLGLLTGHRSQTPPLVPPMSSNVALHLH